jgi:hypothetical protein
MTTINPVGNGLSGTTGTGTFVGNNTPTLVTPVLGAATATSINFGGSTLSTYSADQTWTPVFTFATLGNLSVSYSVQVGTYSRIGNMVFVNFSMTCTPTFTTSSGNMQITGLPFTSSNTANNQSQGAIYLNLTTFGTGYTMATLTQPPNTSYLEIIISGSTATTYVLAAANITTGNQINFSGSVHYPI